MFLRKKEMSKKYTIEEVRKIFEDEGCILQSKVYKNARTPLDYICECRNESKISLDNFKRGKRCNRCGAKKTAEKQKFSYNYVYNYFKEKGCELKSKTYKNTKILLNYICSCGNESEIRFGDFKEGHRCRRCGYQKVANKEKLDILYVRKYFLDRHCKMIDYFYINSGTPINYICSCGNRSKITFDSFRAGHRCKKCFLKRNSGENHHKYNPNLTNEDRIDRRLIHGYIEWAKFVYKKYNYKCVFCGSGKKIQAHHIDGYAENEEIRLDKNNGATLCQSCHYKFHFIYGTVNVNRQQFNEFIKTGENNECK
jgi:hypothetical protein